jgi:23S rRNA pseudouridine2605 synthase
MRINKYLASIGIASRRKIDSLIEQGKVLVNGKPASLGMQVDPQEDRIIVNSESVSQKQELQEKEYWKVYKPAGVVSTVDDPLGRETLIDLVDSKKRLFPVGRLDQESEGLVLMTDDGELAYKLSHPKFEIEKEYLVWVNGSLSSRVVNHLEKGVNLGEFTTAPSKVEVIFREPKKAKFSIVIHEGHNRQIRRMVARAGLTVTRLKRIRIGSLLLGELNSGESKLLTKKELAQLKGVAD